MHSWYHYKLKCQEWESPIVSGTLTHTHTEKVVLKLERSWFRWKVISGKWNQTVTKKKKFGQNERNSLLTPISLWAEQRATVIVRKSHEPPPACQKQPRVSSDESLFFGTETLLSILIDGRRLEDCLSAAGAETQFSPALVTLLVRFVFDPIAGAKHGTLMRNSA